MKSYPPFVAQKRVTSQNVEMLVSGIVSPSDPSIGINYTKTHSKIEMQIVTTSDGFSRNGSVDHSASFATAQIIVASDDFHTGMSYDNFSEIYLGEYCLKANTHFNVGASASAIADTVIATNLATAINRLKEFSASAVGSTVFIESSGSFGSLVHFSKSERQTSTVFTLSPDNGKMDSGLAFGSISKS